MKRVATAIQDMAWLDAVARRDTWAHRVDPRAKAIVTLAFVIVVASFPHRAVVELLPCAAFPVVLFVGARLPLRLLRRPLGIALVLSVLIGIANPWLDQEPVRIGRDTIVAGGWLSFVSILLRAGLCVSAAVALMATTGIERLSHALVRLGVPRVAVTQLLFLYRYAFLLGAHALAMTRARDLRSSGRPLRLATYGPLVGHLLLRTLDHAERIHQAMACRGFSGDVPIRDAFCWRWVDTAFAVAWAGFFVVLRWPGLAELASGWLGRGGA